MLIRSNSGSLPSKKKSLRNGTSSAILRSETSWHRWRPDKWTKSTPSDKEYYQDKKNKEKYALKNSKSKEDEDILSDKNILRDDFECINQAAAEVQQRQERARVDTGARTIEDGEIAQEWM